LLAAAIGRVADAKVLGCEVDARYVTTFDLIQVQGETARTVRGDELFREQSITSIEY